MYIHVILNFSYLQFVNERVHKEKQCIQCSDSRTLYKRTFLTDKNHKNHTVHKLIEQICDIYLIFIKALALSLPIAKKQ